MQGKHAAHPIKAAYRRFSRAMDKTMTPAQMTISGAILGLGMAFLLFHCYFG